MDKIYSRKRMVLPKTNISIFNKSFKKNLQTIKCMKIIVIIAIAITTANQIVRAIEPIMDKQCITIAKGIATKISNQQATVVMSNYDYDDLCNITKDSNGNIAMISANVITVNEIISDVAIKIQEELDKEENNSYNIRLGMLTGMKLLSGVGPNIKVKIETIGGLDTELKSEFESAGINQTLHRLYLQVECNVIILTPYNTKEEKIVNQVLLGEAVIIGTTPNTYYNLEGMEKNNAIDIVE